MKGFFSTSTLIVQRLTGESTLPKCGTCNLYKGCLSPKMPCTGEGHKKILIVAEAPGKLEDKRNTQLIGSAGQKLRELLRKHKVDLDKDCWKTNAVICRPPYNQTPTNEQIMSCLPNLLKTIAKTQPNCIILLGGISVQSLIGHLTQENISNRTIWMGQQIPSRDLNAWICPTYHPSYLLRMQSSLIERLTAEHLKSAIIKAKSKPYKSNLADLEDSIEPIYKPSKAAKYIQQITKKGGRIAFDFEANCLKPEYEGSQLYSCSICWNGKRTIAFPWGEAVIEPMVELIKSPIQKIAANLKFEHRWCLCKLRTKVQRWIWDTMLASHVIDNRAGVTGLKFQAFAMLGQGKYNSHIEQLLKTTNKNHINRIDEIDMKDLLIYNGLDSLLEYKLAIKQMKLLGKEIPNGTKR